MLRNGLCAILPALSLCLIQCDSGGGGSEDQDAAPRTGGYGDDGSMLSESYPGDVGMADDPAVLWTEDFEAGSIDGVISRYDDYKNPEGMELVSDVSPESPGDRSMAMRAGGGYQEATDLFKNFGKGDDEWYIRWYVKYRIGAVYHHTGMWFGGYNPPLDWPNPRAGDRPGGDELFSVAVEASPDRPDRLDFYNYWMRMHSWSAAEESFWGNALVFLEATEYDDQWRCVEAHFRVNTDLESSAGAELELWIDDENIVTFNETEGLGYWVADKFCLENADLPGCTDYPPEAGQEMIPLDLQVRTVRELRLNHLWPQNYSDEDETVVWYDDIVVATRRIGCVR